MICLKISTFVVSTTTLRNVFVNVNMLWFAWKYLPLWYQQQHHRRKITNSICCDLLENIYLCGINNNPAAVQHQRLAVVICLKISTFVVSTTTQKWCRNTIIMLWFAWKYLPLWYQQQHGRCTVSFASRCDLLENIYLCGINNNRLPHGARSYPVVICLKISTFVVSTTTRLSEFPYKEQLWFAWKYLPLWYQQQL